MSECTACKQHGDVNEAIVRMSVEIMQLRERQTMVLDQLTVQDKKLEKLLADHSERVGAIRVGKAVLIGIATLVGWAITVKWG